MTDHGRLPSRVHLYVAIFGWVAAVFGRLDGIIWLLTAGLSICCTWLYLQSLERSPRKREDDT